jgi:hypothetical protein
VIAAAGYDESNSYSAAALRIRELAFSAEVPSLPMDGLMDEESTASPPGVATRSAAV